MRKTYGLSVLIVTVVGVLFVTNAATYQYDFEQTAAYGETVNSGGDLNIETNSTSDWPCLKWEASNKYLGLNGMKFNCKAGVWVQADSVDFGDGLNYLEVPYASGSNDPGIIRLHVDSMSGTVICSLRVVNTGGNSASKIQFLRAPIVSPSPTGYQNIWFVADTCNGDALWWWDLVGIPDRSFNTAVNWIPDGIPSAGDMLEFNAATEGYSDTIHWDLDVSVLGKVTTNPFFNGGISFDSVALKKESITIDSIVLSSTSSRLVIPEGFQVLCTYLRQGIFTEITTPTNLTSESHPNLIIGGGTLVVQDGSPVQSSIASAGSLIPRAKVVQGGIRVSGITDQTRVDLFDSHGRRVAGGIGTRELSTKGLSEGSYILRVSEGVSSTAITIPSIGAN